MTSEGEAITLAANAQKTVAETALNLLAAPGEGADLLTRATAWLQTGDGVRAFADILVIVVVAAGLEWLYWTFALPAWRDAEAADPASRWDALKLAVRRFVVGGLAILLSLLAVIATSAGFAWPDGVQDVVVTFGVGLAAVRLVALGAHVVLAPRAPRLRLVRMRNPEAQSLSRWLVGGAALLAVGLLLPDLVERIGGEARLAGALRALTVVVLAALLLAAVSALDRAARARNPAPPARRVKAIPRPFLALLWIVAVLVLWTGGLERSALTLLIVSATLVAESVSRRAVRFLWTVRQEDRAQAEAPGDDAPLPGGSASILPDLSLRLARLLVALVGGLAVAVVWGVPGMPLSAMETPGGRVVSRILGALAVILVADLAWAALRGAIDNRLERIARAGDPETGSNARLVTLLPLARKASGVVILVLLVLSVLSIIGVEITPLLAGAGVVGIAVGFGAQTLVRDVLSGVFYLAEDVFRIGDYIEGGGSAKGTVERITLRTVALRHQNGPLHFVPYGVLGAVRNNSRDWVVDKFEIPLPVDVDSEFVRKTVKKIGQQMLEDPALASVIVEPLKAKLYRIVPGAKIFRCKVQTPPGKQFEVRSEAYKRIEAALREAGIRFADQQTHVVVQGPAGPPEAPAKAAAPA
ncbi:MAG: mechanosensitive ion channel family protein [Alsobacter sp.]